MKARMAVLALLVVPLGVVVAPAYGGGNSGGGDYCEQGASHGSGGDYCECPSGDAVPEYCQHQPPDQGETRVIIRGHKLELTRDNRLPVELRCSGPAGTVCRGALYLRSSNKLVASKDFRIESGSGGSVALRPSSDFVRELEARHRVPVNAVAHQDGASSAGDSSKDMVAVADDHGGHGHGKRR